MELHFRDAGLPRDFGSDGILTSSGRDTTTTSTIVHHLLKNKVFRLHLEGDDCYRSRDIY